jgi:hypothetical protein
MLSLHLLAGTIQADRERLIRRQTPATAGRPALAHPVRPHVGEWLVVTTPRPRTPAETGA